MPGWSTTAATGAGNVNEAVPKQARAKVLKVTEKYIGSTESSLEWFEQMKSEVEADAAAAAAAATATAAMGAVEAIAGVDAGQTAEKTDDITFQEGQDVIIFC